ncbi:PHP domain-containing protein [Nanoarchaeota archaeon]
MTKITSNSDILKDKTLNFVDMHHHSNISDGDNSPEFLAKAFKKVGYGLCIADHNQIKGAVYLSKQKDIFSIPAIEITSKQTKDILGYFYSIKDLISFWEKEIKKKISPNKLFNLNTTSIDTIDIIDKITDYNGIPVLAHPFALKPKDGAPLMKNKEIVKKIKAIESHNFVCAKFKKTMEFVKQFNKPLIAGSDSHGLSPMITLTGSAEFEINSFLDSILKKKNIIYYKNTAHLKRIIDKLIIVKNNISLRFK